LQLTQKNAFYNNKVNLKKKKFTELYLSSQIAANNYLNRFYQKSSYIFRNGTNILNEIIFTKLFLLKAESLSNTFKKFFVKLKKKKLFDLKNQKQLSTK
jgi:hypothetical protein